MMTMAMFGLFSRLDPLVEFELPALPPGLRSRLGTSALGVTSRTGENAPGKFGGLGGPLANSYCTVTRRILGITHPIQNSWGPSLKTVPELDYYCSEIKGPQPRPEPGMLKRHVATGGGWRQGSTRNINRQHEFGPLAGHDIASGFLSKPRVVGSRLNAPKTRGVRRQPTLVYLPS